jgi:2-polyprenyl-3-methyl-5-hydroxy-6-metoxy-1,4-benzoquinol methylase
MMYIDKSDGKGPEANRAKESRMLVMSALCRGRVLEFGCGTGVLSGKIRDRGLEVIGVDRNKEKIDQARLIHEDIRFILNDVLELSLPARSFDTVILPEILEHVSEEQGDIMLKIAWELLEQGGRMIVSVPNENLIPHPNHIRIFNRHSLAAILSFFGKPVSVTEQPYKWLMMYVEKE